MSPQVSAKTFFMDKDEDPPSGYYNNDGQRNEIIKSNESKRNFSRKHKKIADYLNSDKEPLASDTKWTSKKVLQIGVIKQYRTEEYAKYACKVIDAFDMESEGVKVRVIFLPNLVAYNRLELLAEHKCV
ncbi:hypothetical protein ACMXYN_07290 [Neptuniibacter sp. PT8_73]|uniref:hypothetical protein n=1 Tax=Neptuniibacter sp. PT8_73 TaxID=3398206 RepID=UPI0039F5180A